jgi:hypothetical protein
MNYELPAAEDSPFCSDGAVPTWIAADKVEPFPTIGFPLSAILSTQYPLP